MTSSFYENGRRPYFSFQMEDDLKCYQIEHDLMQPKRIKSKNNGCGTAPGNLVFLFKRGGKKGKDQFYSDFFYLCYFSDNLPLRYNCLYPQRIKLQEVPVNIWFCIKILNINFQWKKWIQYAFHITLFISNKQRSVSVYFQKYRVFYRHKVNPLCHLL